VTLRTVLRGARLALLFSALPVTLAAATPASAQSLVGASPVGVSPLAASFGSAIYPARGRYVLVDAASARLFMVEDGRIVDSMKVIVGKPTSQTPTIASKIYYATLNPYWNVPEDLARTLIAPRVLEQGVRYLREHNYEVLDGFGDDAAVISPAKVDWKAVAAGRATVRMRQLPGPANSMGRVKFGFPNNAGVYLHDTPKKELFASDERALSNGCVRLEDAPRLARWLMGRDPSEFAARPEENVLLPQAVPIYITYLNDPGNAQLAFAAGSANAVSR
jgi:murein L,D-transpeptidase YcbB/YkuD